MTIEANLASIAKSLEIIAAIVQNRNVIEPVPAAAPVAAPVVAPVVEAPAVVPNVPQVVAQTSVATLPVITPTVTILSTTTDTKSTIEVFANHTAFVEFVMNSYKTLGPIKGAKIQDVLTASGVKNINDVQAFMYAAVKSGIEALLA